eukprot:CAMPEP_0182426148 /NCGR_PEP_ID=MMETSP1167-20130531/12632_1 /TAXON_ID=2988 /ORGANISM="Mallomonas Sp, Strain CCMP3275" /LENGTH=708 /DNA_ID=CAMNT_0024607385 /DNA_START=2046 /DNA_END=4172 /DNA_ORIENTATION=+
MIPVALGEPWTDEEVRERIDLMINSLDTNRNGNISYSTFKIWFFNFEEDTKKWVDMNMDYITAVEKEVREKEMIKQQDERLSKKKIVIDDMTQENINYDGISEIEKRNMKVMLSNNKIEEEVDHHGELDDTLIGWDQMIESNIQPHTDNNYNSTTDITESKIDDERHTDHIKVESSRAPHRSDRIRKKAVNEEKRKGYRDLTMSKTSAMSAAVSTSLDHSLLDMTAAESSTDTTSLMAADSGHGLIIVESDKDSTDEVIHTAENTLLQADNEGMTSNKVHEMSAMQQELFSLDDDMSEEKVQIEESSLPRSLSSSHSSRIHIDNRDSVLEIKNKELKQDDKDVQPSLERVKSHKKYKTEKQYLLSEDDINNNNNMKQNDVIEKEEIKKEGDDINISKDLNKTNDPSPSPSPSILTVTTRGEDMNKELEENLTYPDDDNTSKTDFVTLTKKNLAVDYVPEHDLSSPSRGKVGGIYGLALKDMGQDDVASTTSRVSGAGKAAALAAKAVKFFHRSKPEEESSRVLTFEDMLGQEERDDRNECFVMDRESIVGLPKSTSRISPDNDNERNTIEEKPRRVSTISAIFDKKKSSQSKGERRDAVPISSIPRLEDLFDHEEENNTSEKTGQSSPQTAIWEQLEAELSTFKGKQLLHESHKKTQAIKVIRSRVPEQVKNLPTGWVSEYAKQGEKPKSVFKFWNRSEENTHENPSK